MSNYTLKEMFRWGASRAFQKYPEWAKENTLEEVFQRLTLQLPDFLENTKTIKELVYEQVPEEEMRRTWEEYMKLKSLYEIIDGASNLRHKGNTKSATFEDISATLQFMAPHIKLDQEYNAEEMCKAFVKGLGVYLQRRAE